MYYSQMLERLILSLFFLITVSSCSLSPGMHLESDKNWLTSVETIYIESLDKTVPIYDISEYANVKIPEYKIGIGDQVNYFVWGIPDVFPTTYAGPEQSLRRVDSNGDIYFPFSGTIKAEGKTISQLRDDVTKNLSNFFTDPQLDLNLARFNSQFVFVLGEVTVPQKVFLNDIPLSLSSALGEVKGIDRNTGNGSEIFIIRSVENGEQMIYRADISSPAGFLSANQFYLQDKDIVYVNAKGTARWNRVISQFFPFSSFLNSVDNLIED